MQTLAWMQLLLCAISIRIEAKALSSRHGLVSNKYLQHERPDIPIQKRADGQALWDAVRSKYKDRDTCDISKQDTYDRNYKRFNGDLPNEQAPANIRGVIDSLPLVSKPVTFTRITNTCAALPYWDSQQGACFDNFYSIGSGIIIGAANDRTKDLVPQNEQLHWSDIAFYTYKALIAEANLEKAQHSEPSTSYSVKDIKYIFRHSIRNKVPRTPSLPSMLR